MTEMTGNQKLEFLRRSYSSIDGLWFLKVEERYGFETALNMDEEVWKVFPKIQIRMLKTSERAERGCGDLRRCLSIKLALESFEFQIDDSQDESLSLIITRCPWHGLMVKSGREDLSGKVGQRICRTEYSVWAAEFGCELHFDNSPRICTGAQSCQVWFTTRTE